jgi:hypothetical protein
MVKRTMGQRIYREPTVEQAARYRKIRELISEEIPESDAQVRAGTPRNVLSGYQQQDRYKQIGDFQIGEQSRSQSDNQHSCKVRRGSSNGVIGKPHCETLELRWL